MPAGAALVAYLAGFSVATLALTFAGRGLGALSLKSHSRVTRAIGAALVGAGVMFAG